MGVRQRIESLAGLARRRWEVTLVVGSLTAGGILLLLFSLWGAATSESGLLPILAAGLSVEVGILGLVVVLHAKVNKKGYEIRETRSLVNIRPMLGPRPLTLGGDWAIDAILAERLVNIVMEETPDLVVECGSGSSTVLIAACLREIGRGKLVSVDHDARFRDRTHHLLEVRGLLDWAEVALAPLQVTEVENLSIPWYATNRFEALEMPIDLLVVDGPPGKTARLARYPAVPLLKDGLSESAIVILDDGRRVDEREIAKLWSLELGGSLAYIDCTHGAWILRRSSGAE